ncbi:MAG: hypothetical protein R3B09_07545 [Nannocystaceae bacterium]
MSEPKWFSTLLSSIETSISRCIELTGPLDPVALTPSPSVAVGETHVLALSARTPEELDNLIWWWTNVLEDTSVSVPRCCATAALRRHHEHRIAVVARSRESFLEGLRAIARERLVLWCEPGLDPQQVRLAVLHVRGKWVDWRSHYGGERLRLFSGGE